MALPDPTAIGRALPWLLALLIIAGAAWVVRDQQHTSQQILFTLNQVKTTLDEESKRSRDLEQQVAALIERVVGLERELATLKERVRSLSRRPIAIARSSPVLDVIALAPLASSPEGLEPSSPEMSIAIETLPITWATDWRSFQPAGIMAPPARVVIERRLSDPAFLKRLYVGYAALQIGDIITTTRALGRGAREGNPLLANVAHSPAALIGVKAAAGVATILAIEKLRQKHPVVASVTLIAINATLAAVTINNVSMAAQQDRAKP
jgi:hypothetical protein